VGGQYLPEEFFSGVFIPLKKKMSNFLLVLQPVDLPCIAPCRVALGLVESMKSYVSKVIVFAGFLELPLQISTARSILLNAFQKAQAWIEKARHNGTDIFRPKALASLHSQSSSDSTGMDREGKAQWHRHFKTKGTGISPFSKQFRQHRHG
jgi:hypothetical protein